VATMTAEGMAVKCPGSVLLAGLLGLLLLGGGARAEVLQGRVVAIADGDTITVVEASLKQHRVRLAGIDAPERRQPYSNRSKLALSALVMGKSVTVDWTKVDRYQRLIGVVRQGNDDAGLVLLRAGLAWHYKAYVREQSPQDRKLYSEAEQQARSARLGLWSDAAPQPPWEFRHERRSSSRPRSHFGLNALEVAAGVSAEP
jgi:endonuclease YncB( thermonuclease family)